MRSPPWTWARAASILSASNSSSPRRSPAAYAQAIAQQHDKTRSSATNTLLSEISGTNGRCQDLRDAYSAVKDEYSQVWLNENRPYWLNNVTVRYDLEIQKWQQRGKSVRGGNSRLAKRAGSACARCPGIARASRRRALTVRSVDAYCLNSSR